MNTAMYLMITLEAERRLKSAWEHIVDCGYKNDDPEIH